MKPFIFVVVFHCYQHSLNKEIFQLFNIHLKVNEIKSASTSQIWRIWSPVNFCFSALLLFADFRNVNNTFATNRTLSRLHFAFTDPFMSTLHTYPFCHLSHFHSNISTFTLKTVISLIKRALDAVSFFGTVAFSAFYLFPRQLQP